MSPAVARLLADASRLPADVIGDLIEALIGALDARTPDADLEPEIDACEAGDDLGTIPYGRWDWGDEVHAARAATRRAVTRHRKRRAA